MTTDEAHKEKKECPVCFGKGYNEEWKFIEYEWGDWFRIICDECEGVGQVDVE
jgi:DnaJ-class molecular chaperone